MAKLQLLEIFKTDFASLDMIYHISYLFFLLLLNLVEPKVSFDFLILIFSKNRRQ